MVLMRRDRKKETTLEELDRIAEGEAERDAYLSLQPTQGQIEADDRYWAGED